MTATIDGAEITLLVELGDATMVLGRDHLGDVMNGPMEGAADLSCDTITASWTWGASEYRRNLTVPETGQLIATVDDPDRRFDPTNERGPHYAALRRDRPVRVIVGAYESNGRHREFPAWTGKVKTWSHDWMTGRTTLTAYDGLDEAGRISVSVTAPAGTPVQQGIVAAQDAGVPLDTVGNFGDILRSTHYFGGTLLEALADCRFATLGHYWVDHSGHLHLTDRSFLGTNILYASPFIIGCKPYPEISGIAGTLDRAEIVNGVKVDRFDPQGDNLTPYVFRVDSSIAAHGPHYVVTSEQELDLEPSPGQSVREAYEEWANILLNENTGMPLPADEIVLYSVIAEGMGVVHLACSEYKAPFILRFPGYFGRRLNLYGMKVSVTPDGWTFSPVAGRTFGYPPNTENPT
jgi:hypothetical protein